MTIGSAESVSVKVYNLTYTFFVASLGLFLDRFSKFIILKSMIEGESIKVLPNIFHVTLVFNNGAAFGLFKDQRAFFIALSCLVMGLILFSIYNRKAKDILLSSVMGLILGGASGNLIDRIRFGYVIDFLDFRIWPVFNIADTCITLGATMLIIFLFLRREKDASGIT